MTENPLKHLEDEQLVKAFQRSRDQMFFAELYNRHRDRVYSKVCVVTQDYANAEDLTHDIFLKLYFRLGQFKGQSQFSTWLYRIVMNGCFDEIRKRKTRKETPLEPEMQTHGEGEETPFEQMVANAKRNHIEAALAHLDPQDRSLILLKYQDELSAAEIGGIYGASENAIRQRIFRAKKAFIAYYLPLAKTLKNLILTILFPWL